MLALFVENRQTPKAWSQTINSKMLSNTIKPPENDRLFLIHDNTYLHDVIFDKNILSLNTVSFFLS